MLDTRPRTEAGTPTGELCECCGASDTARYMLDVRSAPKGNPGEYWPQASAQLCRTCAAEKFGRT